MLKKLLIFRFSKNNSDCYPYFFVLLLSAMSYYDVVASQFFRNLCFKGAMLNFYYPATFEFEFHFFELKLCAFVTTKQFKRYTIST